MNYLQRSMRQATTTPGKTRDKGPVAENSAKKTVHPVKNAESGDGVLAYAAYNVTAQRLETAVSPLVDKRVTEAARQVTRERICTVAAVITTTFYLIFLGFMLNTSAGHASTGLMATREAGGRLVVSWVVPAGMAYDIGVRPGAVILRHDGVVATGGTGEEINMPDVKVLELAQDGKSITLDTGQIEGNNQIRRWGYALLGLIFVFIGGPVFVKARQRTAASTFYLFCVSTAFALATAMAAFLSYSWALALQFTMMLIVAATFAFFFFQFPVALAKTQRQRMVFIGALGGAAAAVLLGYIWVLVSSPYNYEMIQPIYYLYLVSCCGAGLLRLLISFTGERSPEVRRQRILLVIGTALAFGPSLILGLIPQLVFGQSVSIGTTAYTLGFLPLFFAYAITQHQLLGIRGFIRRSVVYLIMGFTVLIAFFIMAALASTFLSKGWAGEDWGILGFGIFVFLIAVSFGYVQRRVEWMVDRFVYHDAYDYKQALQQFSTQLAAEQDLNALSQELVERTCRLMNLDCGALLLAIHPGEVSAMVTRKALPAHQGDGTAANDANYNLPYEDGKRHPGAALMVNAAHNHTDARQGMRGKETLPNVHDQGTEPSYLLAYAQYGSCADWLPQGLHMELARHGMDLKHTNAPTELFSFYAGPSYRTTGPIGTGPLGRRFGDGEDTMRHKPAGSRNAYPEGSRQFLGVPLWTRQHFVGILCLGGKTTGERFGKDDLSLLTTLGGQAALAIYNAQLYEMREQALLDTITALAHAIEAKDTYTLNHCEMITGRAVALAQSIGLPQQDVENIRLGSILHDVGKIGIPDAILNKPARLTDEEYERIKEHAVIGARIVQSVGALQGVVPIIRHHQERYDGSGYPDGLSGDSIPVGARIIAVVDAYGAMTEDRVYRKAPGHEVAIGELKRWAGKQFDPYIAEAFVRLLEEQPEYSDAN